MIVDSPLLALSILSLGALIFLLLFVLPRRKSSDEVGIRPLHEERCNIRKSLGFGFFAGGNLPVWRLSLYQDFIIIAFLWPILIRYADIDRVEYKRHLLSSGIYIFQRNRTVITLFPRNPEKVIEVLASRIKVNSAD